VLYVTPPAYKGETLHMTQWAHRCVLRVTLQALGREVLYVTPPAYKGEKLHMTQWVHRCVILYVTSGSWRGSAICDSGGI
jgi:hypothetical protein